MIRAARFEDVEKLAELSRQCLTYFWNEKDFSDTLCNSQAHVLVYEANKEQDTPSILGYIVLYHAADEGEIPSVGVHPAARRHGIGRQLLSALMEQCLGLGVKKLFLEVRESNDPAQRLYETQGFLRVGVRKNFYDSPTEDAFIMMRKM